MPRVHQGHSSRNHLRIDEKMATPSGIYWIKHSSDVANIHSRSRSHLQYGPIQIDLGSRIRGDSSIFQCKLEVISTKILSPDFNGTSGSLQSKSPDMLIF